MIIKPIVTRKKIMHRIFGERFAPRMQFGLSDIERRMMDERRRLRNNGLAIAIIGLAGAMITDYFR